MAEIGISKLDWVDKIFKSYAKSYAILHSWTENTPSTVLSHSRVTNQKNFIQLIKIITSLDWMIDNGDSLKICRS